MSKAEILAENPKLTKEEHQEVRARLTEIDGLSYEEWLDNDSLTDDEKKLIDQRLAEHNANPASAMPFEEFQTRLKRA